MKKFLSVFLALAMIACVVAGFAGCSKSGKDDEVVPYSSSKGDTTVKTVADLDKVKDANKIVVGITDYEPIDYKVKGSDEWVGFDADLVRAVADKMSIKVEFVVINWDNKFIAGYCEIFSLIIATMVANSCCRISRIHKYNIIRSIIFASHKLGQLFIAITYAHI